MLRILLVGYGKMGRLVGSLAGEYGSEIVGYIDEYSVEGPEGASSDRWQGVDVAIDFSSPEAVGSNAPVLAKRGINLVIGTTGWQRDEPAVRQAVAEGRVGAVVAPNFSTSVAIFESVVSHAAKLFAGQAEFGAFLHETHHAAKKDAPSGTAIRLKHVMEEAGFTRPIDVSSSRVGFVPGTHTIGFDGPGETISLSHTARDRSAFARGALVAAQWVKGRQGWFTLEDVLGIGR
jgi:4-hydroxy-tetrahydrodipicolinate reductase